MGTQNQRNMSRSEIKWVRGKGYPQASPKWSISGVGKSKNFLGCTLCGQLYVVGKCDGPAAVTARQWMTMDENGTSTSALIGPRQPSSSLVFSRPVPEGLRDLVMSRAFSSSLSPWWSRQLTLRCPWQFCWSFADLRDPLKNKMEW